MMRLTDQGTRHTISLGPVGLILNEHQRGIILLQWPSSTYSIYDLWPGVTTLQALVHRIRDHFWIE